jgi:hypothetical protein
MSSSFMVVIGFCTQFFLFDSGTVEDNEQENKKFNHRKDQARAK